MKNLLQPKNEIRNSKEAYKRATEKKRTRLTCIYDIYWIEEVLGYRDVTESLKFQQAGADNWKTESNRNDELPTFDEEREYRKIRENMRITSINSRPILSANFHVPTFYHVSVSFLYVWFSRQVPSHFPFER